MAGLGLVKTFKTFIIIFIIAVFVVLVQMKVVPMKEQKKECCAQKLGLLC